MRRDWVAASALGAGAALLTAVLNPRIGIRDIDAYAYIIGARSIAAGRGYTDLAGAYLNHWPPLYSYVLSRFPEPLPAALAVNYVCLGLAAALLYLVLRRCGWQMAAAAGVTIAFAAGFFRVLATAAKPDIIAFALFLAGLYLHRHGSTASRTGAYLAWAAAIPFKYIAVTFIPAALIAEAAVAKPKRVAEWLAGAAAWLASIFGVLLFNRITSGEAVPSTHPAPLFGRLEWIAHALYSIPRQMLSHWYGPLWQAPAIYIAGAVSLCGFACLAFLRPGPDRRWQLAFAAAILGMTFAIGAAKAIEASVRIIGYGCIAVLCSFAPAVSARVRALWAAYAAAAVAGAAVNAAWIDSAGANDPRYRPMALAISRCLPKDMDVATNSFHLLDLHAGAYTTPLKSPSEARQFPFLLWVTLPRFDPVATAVSPLPRPADGWCEVCTVQGAALYRNCGAGKVTRRRLSTRPPMAVAGFSGGLKKLAQ